MAAGYSFASSGPIRRKKQKQAVSRSFFGVFSHVTELLRYRIGVVTRDEKFHSAAIGLLWADSSAIALGAKLGQESNQVGVWQRFVGNWAITAVSTQDRQLHEIRSDAHK